MKNELSAEEIALKVYLFAKGTSFIDEDERRIRRNQEYMIPRKPGEASMDILDLRGYIEKNFDRDCVDAVMDCFNMESRGDLSVNVIEVGVFICLKPAVVEELKRNNKTKLSAEEIALKVYLFAKGTSFIDEDERRIRRNQEYMIPRKPGEASMDILDLRGYIEKNFDRDCVDAVMDCFNMESRGDLSVNVIEVGVFICLKPAVIETLKRNNLYILE